MFPPVCPSCRRMLAALSFPCAICRGTPPPPPACERAWDEPRRKKKYRLDDDDFDLDRPRKRGRTRGVPTKGMLWAVAGIPLALIVLSLLFLGGGAGSGLLMLATALGFVVVVVGSVWLLGVVASDSVGQLLLCLFIPFYSLFYVLSNFDTTRKPFFTYLFGLLIVGLSYGAAGLHEKAAARREQSKSDNPTAARPATGGAKAEPPKDEGPRLGAVSLAAPFDVDPQAKAAGEKIYLTGLTPFAYQTGPWKLGVGGKGSDGKEPILYEKKKYVYAISLHPPQSGPCRVSFAPGGEFKRFKGWAAIGDGDKPWGAVLFAVWGDDKKLWESDGFTTPATAVGFDLDVTGVKVLVLETRMKTGHNHAAHAVWLDPWLER